MGKINVKQRGDTEYPTRRALIRIQGGYLCGGSAAKAPVPALPLRVTLHPPRWLKIEVAAKTNRTFNYRTGRWEGNTCVCAGGESFRVVHLARGHTVL